jgi:glycosyl transferase, family 25
MNIDIRVISLDTAVERRRHVAELFANSGLEWSFFDAHRSLRCDGVVYDPKTVIQNFGRPMTQPEIAVSSSHMSVLAEFLRDSASDFIFVMEDDVIFDTAFPLPRLARLCRDHDIHYIRLFGKHPVPFTTLGSFYDRSIIRMKTTPTGGQGYLMTKQGARQFLENFRVITSNFDMGMDNFWITKLPLYAVFPYPIIERFSPTQIPIPDRFEPMSRADMVRFNLHRVARKSRKIVENLALTTRDRALAGTLASFHQIYQEDVKAPV